MLVLFHSASQNTVETRVDYLDSTKSGIVIRDPKAYSIIKKISKKEGPYFLSPIKNFTSLVSPKDFFTNKEVLTSSWEGYQSRKSNTVYIKYYLNKNIHQRDYGWISLQDVPKIKPLSL